MFLPTLFITAVFASGVHPTPLDNGPFLVTISETEHVIGNSIWNITIGQTYGTKLYYKDKDLVGNAAGHYVSYSVYLPYVI